MNTYMIAIDPVAISLGPVSIHWYGILMGTAFILGLSLAMFEAKRRGIDPEILLDLMIWVIPSAIVGARLYYVIFEWENYMLNPADIIAVWKGGLAIHGGLIGAFIAGFIFVRKHKIPFLVLADLIAPSILLGQMIGRWGNFINQEAHGGPVKQTFLQSLHLPNWLIEQMNIQGVYYHPTFLYESLWSLVGVALLILLRHFNPKRGEIFFAYLTWYSLGRYFIEGMRTDSLAFNGPVWLESFLNAIWSPMTILFDPGILEGGNIRVAQLLSIFLIILSIGLIIWRRSQGLKENYRDMDQVKSVSSSESDRKVAVED